MLLAAATVAEMAVLLTRELEGSGSA